MRFIPIGDDFVAEVIDIDLRAPAAIHAAMDRHAVLVFRYPVQVVLPSGNSQELRGLNL
jgi:hypothetical protein